MTILSQTNVLQIRAPSNNAGKLRRRRIETGLYNIDLVHSSTDLLNSPLARASFVCRLLICYAWKKSLKLKGAGSIDFEDVSAAAIEAVNEVGGKPAPTDVALLLPPLSPNYQIQRPVSPNQKEAHKVFYIISIYCAYIKNANRFL